MTSISFVAVIAPLAACSNRVVSETPWFRQSVMDERPKFRDGVWRVEDPRCKVKETKPVERWPVCASWGYLRHNQSLTPQWIEEGKGRNRRRTYGAWSVTESVLVSGDPVIRQSNDCSLAAESVASDGNAEGAPPDSSVPAREVGLPAPIQQPHVNFCYEAVRATAFDGMGSITAAETWPVLCGPWPLEGGNVTDRPWQGLSIVGDNCNATSEAALREAARRSREVVPVVSVHWVRDGYR
ncbi:hypothetical protein IAG41_22800 [Sphingomonas sp. JC676]|uniref:hypothetical protein n=1 Tax=Sphingomonas sp. JC676 TaxID=2768065 RepID=UPI001658340B|nr:hypothetical protein [Sphingomonas sp. JC676]MBC9035230.1 hypothetical protein [Sphingomonas sp. JC676]